LETNVTKAIEKNNERFILNLQKLYVQRLFYKPKGRNAICWAFYVVNDNKPMDRKVPQIMRCRLCYKMLMLKKGLISYCKSNVILTLNKHDLLAKKLDERSE
jgi:hypothetical protein